MRKFLIIFLFLLSSCNPAMHLVGGGMRYHNLSQNKYQPNKQRPKINVGRSPISPFWIFFGRF